MSRNKKDIKQFVESINDEKLENFDQREYCIKEDYKLGMRLDHQGMNQDGTHRIYIQPLKGGKARTISKLKSDKYISQIHVIEGAAPADVREALEKSAKDLGARFKVGKGNDKGNVTKNGEGEGEGESSGQAGKSGS